jgi:hypothetical protein
MPTKGDRILDTIMQEKLFSCECRTCGSHDVVTTWSPHAPEHLEAVTTQVPRGYVELLFSVDQHLGSLTEEQKRGTTAFLLQLAFRTLKELP